MLELKEWELIEPAMHHYDGSVSWEAIGTDKDGVEWSATVLVYMGERVSVSDEIEVPTDEEMSKDIEEILKEISQGGFCDE